MVEVTMLRGSLSSVVVYVQSNFLFPIVRLLRNTNGRPYLLVVTNKKAPCHHCARCYTGPIGVCVCVGRLLTKC